MRQISRLILLKIRELTRLRWLVILMLLAPPLLGVIAGQANLANRTPQIRLAWIDQEQSPFSRKLAEAMRSRGWILEDQGPTVDRIALERAYLRQDIDGILSVRPGFTDSPDTLHETERYLIIEPAPGSPYAPLVREAAAAVIIPEYTRRALLRRLADRADQIGQSYTEETIQAFDRLAERYAAQEARIELRVIGGRPAEPSPVVLTVTDYSMEVFFLSVYALLGVLLLAPHVLRRRLASVNGGLSWDYLASLAALMLVGLIQILAYTAAMNLILKTPFTPDTLWILAVYLLMMLALSQILRLIPESLRLTSSLLIILLLAVAGGCFFRLPGPLIERFAQYLPTGWALAGLQGYPVIAPGWVLLVAAALLVGGVFTLRRDL